MKILIDARESGTTTGRYIDKLIENLAKLDTELEFMVLSKSHRIEYLKKIAPKFQIIRSDIKEFTFEEQLNLLRQIQLLSPDLVHFGMVQQPILYSGKVVTTIHDLTTLRFNNPDKNFIVFKSKQQIYKQVIKKSIKKSRFIITPSIYTKDDLIDFSGDSPSKFRVIYEAADNIKGRSIPYKTLVGTEYIMYVGRPTPHKNLERLILAYKVLKRKHSKLKLVLVGRTDSNYLRLKKLVQEQKIKGVIFTGFIDDLKLKWLYENTISYVFPSLAEGFGLPSLEAMAHKAPVVSSNTTCLEEINGQAALYFNPYDVNDIVDKIEQMLLDKKLRAKYIKEGSKQVQKYSWINTARQTLNVYRDALS